MILEDLHTRLEVLKLTDLDVFPDADGYRCQIYSRDDNYGDGTGSSIAEAIEGALDDLDANRGEPRRKWGEMNLEWNLRTDKIK